MTAKGQRVIHTTLTPPAPPPPSQEEGTPPECSRGETDTVEVSVCHGTFKSVEGSLSVETEGSMQGDTSHGIDHFLIATASTDDSAADGFRRLWHGWTTPWQRWKVDINHPAREGCAEAGSLLICPFFNCPLITQVSAAGMNLSRLSVSWAITLISILKLINYSSPTMCIVLSGSLKLPYITYNVEEYLSSEH